MGRSRTGQWVTLCPRRRSFDMSKIDRQAVTAATGSVKDDPLSTRTTLLVGAAMIAAYAAVLHLSGQPGWCRYGFAIWADACEHCTSQQVFDPYSFSHVLHGVVLFWLLWPIADRISLQWRAIVALGIEIGWELLENSPWVIERYRQV